MENKTHIIENPCIRTEGGIIKEGGYYFYKIKGKPFKYLIIVEKVLENKKRQITLGIHIPKLGKTTEINHPENQSEKDCEWQIFDGYTKDELDIPELNID